MMRSREKNAIIERYDTESDGAVLITGDDEKLLISGEELSAKKSGRKKKSPATKGDAAEKTAGKSAKKTAASEKKAAKSDEQGISVKTPSVMRLVEDTADVENQVIAAGKSRIPRRLRGIEPLSRVIRREAEAERLLEEKQNEPLVTREITETAADEAAPAVLERFNACDCEVCRAELARLACEQLPSRYMKMPEGEGTDWQGFTKDEQAYIASLKKTVTAVMIRLMLGNKKRNFHG